MFNSYLRPDASVRRCRRRRLPWLYRSRPGVSLARRISRRVSFARERASWSF